MIVIQTSKGDIKLKLDQDHTPKTCANFLEYVRQGFYTDTIFHRVIKGFMIQGGGLTESMETKAAPSKVVNEAKTGKSNKRGTIAMARTSDPHSASSQFFINLVDNNFLNFTAENAQGYGYCVFGEVVEGMDVVDAIAKVSTGNKAGHSDVPTETIKILSISEIE
ncbi:MAG TPA: peptidylprolyl isomerase [Legionellaceae bacterium]|nr:peptidylprolyl isomerase [Legionellaceae bacterium]